MLRFRGTLALAVVAALVSAACFGAGIATVPLVLSALLGENGRSLEAILADVDAKRVGGLIPDSLIDAVPDDQFAAVALVLGLVATLTVIGATAKYLHTYLAMDAAMRTVANVRKAAFYRIVHLPMRSVVAEGTMDRISRIVRDSNQLRNGFVAITSKGVGEILKGVAGLFVALMFDWKLTLIALVGLPVLGAAVRVFSRQVQKASKRALRQSANLLAAVMESMQGIRVVKVHTAERYEAGRFARANKRLLREELSMRQAKALASPVVETLTMFGIALIALVAAWYVIRADVAFEVVFGTVAGLAAAGSAVRPLTQLSTDVHESAAAAERLADLLDHEVETSRGDARPRLAPHSRSLAFEGVRFSYPNASKPALDGVTLEIEHGRMIAFVGPNGSGKTTLLSLVPRLFEPEAGRVLIDGVDIATVSLRSLRRQIGVVTQETVLFNDTIANNIAYGTSHATRARIEEAARQALAEEFILARPEGYDAVVGEQGVTLSGGQRQRLAIARAILRDPRILILDEATSMIDAESEAQITAVLRRFCESRTSLVIAHRLSTVIDADEIVVMDAGRVIDRGTHAQLMDRCDLYRQLCRTQLIADDAPTALGSSAVLATPSDD